MAIDDAERPDTGEMDGGAESASSEAPTEESYTWADYLEEYGRPDDAERLYAGVEAGEEPAAADWEDVETDPSETLGFRPTAATDVTREAGRRAAALYDAIDGSHDFDPDDPPVVKDIYTWEDYKREYYYDEEGNPPTDDEDDVVPFDPAAALGFDPERLGPLLANGDQRGEDLLEVEDERTVDVNPDLDEDAFFSTMRGTTTAVNRYDLEKAVPMPKKGHFEEIERYWVNKPYAFVIIFHSTRENETKYYVVEPYLNRIEDDLSGFLTAKLRTAIKYGDEDIVAGDETKRREVIESETLSLLERYDLYTSTETDTGFADSLAERLGVASEDRGVAARLLRQLGWTPHVDVDGELEGIAARPESAVVDDDDETLTAYQVEKLLYVLKRDFIGYERIDGIKHDINVEDISCDGYDSPVFVYHSDYEQIISNVVHGETELDDFVVKLAQRSGKGISKRRPQVDATLPDGSRAQLTLGREVSDHGTNYTIRQFKDVPFTPVDLINWNTFSLDEMAFLWLCIENHKSLIFAGGTASGKTTSLNAVSLFIPSNSKIVSIEDTREVELPQRNWIASVTRPSFSDDDAGDVDEFDLLEAALRQRPDYIVMGEIRGEEGRTLFQVMSTGHTTYTTFHADSVGEVLKRFTTDPINVSKTMFTALDLVSIQTSTRVEGHKVRRNKSLTEINHYDAENDEINVQDVYQWQAETDEFLHMGESNTIEEIKFDRGWDQERLEEEVFMRRAVLAYLIDRGLNTYTQVAATVQAFINDPDTILALMANDRLERSLEDLRTMESVLIDIDPDKEEMVPRPSPGGEMAAFADDILDRAEEELFEEYRGTVPDSVAEVLDGLESVTDVVAEPIPEESADTAADDGGESDGAADDSPDASEGSDDGSAGTSDLDSAATDDATDPDPSGVDAEDSSVEGGPDGGFGGGPEPDTDVGTTADASSGPDDGPEGRSYTLDMDVRDEGFDVPDDDSTLTLGTVEDDPPEADRSADEGADDPGVDKPPADEAGSDEATEESAGDDDIEDWGFGDVAGDG